MSFTVIIVRIQVNDRKNSHFSHVIINKLNREHIKSIISIKLYQVALYKK